MRNTGSREKWRGNRSRGLRKAPGTRLRGRTPRRAARPPPRLHSDLVSPEPRAPGLLTSRPLLLQRAAQPQLPSLPLARPGSDFCSCAPSPRPAPHALGTRPQSGGAGPGGAGPGGRTSRWRWPMPGSRAGLWAESGTAALFLESAQPLRRRRVDELVPGNSAPSGLGTPSTSWTWLLAPGEPAGWRPQGPQWQPSRQAVGR